MKYVKCPGCGDRGDAEHIAACASLRIDQSHLEAANEVMEMMLVMLGRRDVLTLDDLVRLERAVLSWRRPQGLDLWRRRNSRCERLRTKAERRAWLAHRARMRFAV